MIKVKSQEFAVDRATILTKDYDRLENIIQSTSQMVAAISAQSNAKDLEIQETLEDIKNNLLAEKASQEDFDLMKIKMQERDEKDAQLDSDLALLKAEIEMKEQIKAKEEDKGPAIIVPGETIDAEEIIKDTAEIEKSKQDISPAVLESIQKGASSKTAIVRETGLEEDDILVVIPELVKDKKVIEKKIGKRIKYLTPEQELDEKLQEDKKKPADKKSKKPAKKKESEPEPKKEEKPPTKAKKKDKPKKEEPKEPIKEKKPAKKGAKPKEELPPVDKPKEELPPVDKPKEEPKKPEPKKEKPKPKKADKPKEELPPVDKPKEAAKKPEPKKAEPKPKKVEESKKEELPPVDIPKKAKKPEKEVKPKEQHVDDELPVITKKLEDLSDDERAVLDVISKGGMTISGIQSKVGKSLKRFALLRALRVLIDSGYVGIITKGRMDLYQKINISKVDTKKQNKTQKEVK